MNWQVYIILSSDDSLYTGITTDIDRRFSEHTKGRGAKYFRGRQPLKIVYLEKDHNRSTASKREAQIKAMSRAEKISLQADSRREYKNICDKWQPEKELEYCNAPGTCT